MTTTATNANRCVDIQLHMTRNEAHLFALLLKRLTFSDVLSCAVDRDEAHDMIEALKPLDQGFAEAGFCPR